MNELSTYYIPDFILHVICMLSNPFKKSYPVTISICPIYKSKVLDTKVVEQSFELRQTDSQIYAVSYDTTLSIYSFSGVELDTWNCLEIS